MKKKNMNSKQNLAIFSAATDSENIISSNTTQKRTKQNFVSVFIVRTGTYLYRKEFAPVLLLEQILSFKS